MITNRIGRWALRTMAVAMLVLSTGCTALRENRGATASAGNGGIVLRVTNRSWSDVVVYLQQGSLPRRLGRVPSQGRALLAIPNFAAPPMPIRLFLRGDRRAGSFAPEEIRARPGQIVDLLIQPELKLSYLSVQ